MNPSAAPGPGALLDAIGLAVTPPGASGPCVRDLSLRVRPGEWVALVGENGGGKTSLLLALAGLWPISAGTLTLAGAPFGPERREGAAAGIAVVLQDPGSQLLQPTVGEELTFTARNLGVDEAVIARETARWTGSLGLALDPALDPATLSAGQQQLLLLAAAMVTGPRLLLADEPTAHLDAPTRRRLRAVFGAEVARGLAVVWATQDPDEMAAASRVLVVGVSGAAPDQAPPQESAHWPVGPGGGMAPELRLEIMPVSAGSGPRIGIAAPLTIPVGTGAPSALLGPNGAGKSVLLGAAAGLLDLPQVRVHWDPPPDRPPIIALQYPELQVFEELVADELSFAATARGMSRREALESASNHLRQMGLNSERMLSRRTWSLSTGEKRLVEVIGALIAPSGLVVLDEPTAGLDGIRRRALGELVRQRARAGPVLLSSQDAGWAEMAGSECFRIGV